MSDFAKWLRESYYRGLKDADIPQIGRFVDDLADLTAQQHEALLDFGDSKNCGDQNCKPCRAMKAAEAFKEKWE